MPRPPTKPGPEMRGPGLFDASLGALTGGATGGILGLVAVGIYPAIATGDYSWLAKLTLLSLFSALICAPLGWVGGGLIGPRLGRRFNSPKVEVVAGFVAGLLPVSGVILLVALRFS